MFANLLSAVSELARSKMWRENKNNIVYWLGLAPTTAKGLATYLQFI